MDTIADPKMMLLKLHQQALNPGTITTVVLNQSFPRGKQVWTHSLFDDAPAAAAATATAADDHDNGSLQSHKAVFAVSVGADMWLLFFVR